MCYKYVCAVEVTGFKAAYLQTANATRLILVGRRAQAQEWFLVLCFYAFMLLGTVNGLLPCLEQSDF